MVTHRALVSALLAAAGIALASGTSSARAAEAAAVNAARPDTPTPNARGSAPTSSERQTRLPGFGPRVFGDHPTVAQMTEIGRRIFFDQGLSRSGRMACATCHDPTRAFGPPNGRDVQLGGPAMNRPGTRAVPTLRYLAGTIPFTEHYIDDEEAHGEDGGPSGALTWDGHADSLHEQALIPLFAPHEFANRSPTELAARVRKSGYAKAFDAAFSAAGEPVFDDPARVLGWLTAALEVYQQSASDFYPYSSKYDAFLRHQTTLTDAELRGLAVFNDPGKGNCASCHPSSIGANGSLPRFTDSAYAALGVPRNRRLPANRNPAHVDLGLCEGRAALVEHDQHCGRFKTPTLRNVAVRQAFFHNGAFHSLQQVVEFYAQRDTNPERWYGKDRSGQVIKFDDLPARYHDNVVTTTPFGGQVGESPRLGARDVSDIVAFLKTLTDGWKAPPEIAPEARQVANRLP